jgi:hypothetical protein
LHETALPSGAREDGDDDDDDDESCWACIMPHVFVLLPLQAEAARVPAAAGAAPPRRVVVRAPECLLGFVTEYGYNNTGTTLATPPTRRCWRSCARCTTRACSEVTARATFQFFGNAGGNLRQRARHA